MMGNSRKIKVKHFDSDGIYIDDQINEWLEENDVQVIDIKFTSTITEESLFNDALIIYKK